MIAPARNAKAAQLFKNLHGERILKSPAEAAAFIKADSLRWKQVIVANKIDME